MEGWKTEKFKKLIDYKSGYTWSKEQELAVEEPNSIRVLTVSNVQDKLDLTSELYLAGVSEQDRIKKQVSKDWSIAVSSNGNRNRIGNAIFIDSDTNYLFASFLTAFKPFDEADISPYYFYLWLSSSFVQRKITSVAEGTTGLGNLSVRFLRNMDITFPTDKAEQTAIAKILSTVDEAIQSTRETISKLERVKKSLTQNLLSGKMKPDGTLRPAAEFYEDEKMGLVPMGWTVKAIGEMFDSYPTASYSRSKLFEQGDYKYIHYGDIHTKFDRFLDVSNTELPFVSDDMIKRFVFLQDGDLVIADTSEDYDGVGKLVEIINTNNTKVIAGLHTLMIRSKTDDLINGYKGYLFNEHRVRLSMLKFVTGIKVYSISKSCLAKVLVAVPPTKEQIEIKDKLDSVSKQIQNKQAKITKLELLKKSLMQQLLTGRVRINEQCTINNE